MDLKGAGLTLHVRDVGELLRVAAVAGLLPFQLQEDGDGTLDLGAVIGRRLEDDGVLRKQQIIGVLQSHGNRKSSAHYCPHSCHGTVTLNQKHNYTLKPRR